MTETISMEKLLETRNLKRAAIGFSLLGLLLGIYLMIEESKMLEDMGLVKEAE